MNAASRAHQRKVKAALEAIEEVFNDTSLSQLATISSLREISDDCLNKIGCIEADMRRAERGGSR